MLKRWLSGRGDKGSRAQQVDWRSTCGLHGESLAAFERWLQLRAEIAKEMERTRKRTARRSSFDRVRELRAREEELWQEFLYIDQG